MADRNQRPMWKELITVQKKDGNRLMIMSEIASYGATASEDLATLLLGDDLVVRKLRLECKDDNDAFVRGVFTTWLNQDDDDPNNSTAPCTWEELCRCVENTPGLPGSFVEKIKDHFCTLDAVVTQNKNLVKQYIERQGSIPVRSMKSFFIGPPCVGKTSALRRLTGEIEHISHDEIVPSTGIDAPLTVRLHHPTERTSLLLSEGWRSQGLEEQCRALCSYALNSPSLPPALSSSSQDAAKPTHDTATAAEDELTTALTILVKADDWMSIRDFLTNVKELAFLNIVDIGGQPEFHEILPLLLHGLALNVIFLNTTQDLDSPYTVVYRDGTVNDSLQYMSEYTIRQIIQCALCTISSLQTSENSKPTAILIGTHCDLTDKSAVLALDQSIQESFKEADFMKKDVLCAVNKPGKKRRYIHPLDNISGDPSEIDELRQLISTIVHERFTPVMVPTSALLLHLILQMKFGHTRGWCTLEECIKIAENCGISKEDLLREDGILQYLHDKFGTVLYYRKLRKLSLRVIVNANVIMAPPSRLFLMAFGVLKNEQQTAEHIRATGEISHHLMMKVCSPGDDASDDDLPTDEIVELLKARYILFELASNEPVYFMPALLYPDHNVAKESSNPDLLASLPFPPVVFLPSSGAVPLGQFPATVVNLSKYWKPDERNRYRNRIRFYAKFKDARLLHVELRTLSTHLEFRVLSEPSTDSSSMAESIRKLWQVFAEVSSLYSLNQNITWKVGFYCPHSLQSGQQPHTATCISIDNPQEMICSQKDCEGGLIPLNDKHKIWFTEMPIINTTTTSTPTQETPPKVLCDIDPAADRTLCEFMDQICTFGFKSEDISHLIDISQQRNFQSFSENDRKKIIIGAIRVSPNSDVFPSLMGILDSFPENRDAVQNMQEYYISNGGNSLANNYLYHSSKLEFLMKKKGRMTLNLIHCMPFGPPRVGKTCIKDRLAGRTPKGEPVRRDESGRIIRPGEESPSTGAAEPVLKLMVEVEHSVSTTYHEGEERWIQYDFSEEVVSIIKNLKVQAAGFGQVHNIVEDKVDQETIPIPPELERDMKLEGFPVQANELDENIKLKDIVMPIVELEESIESIPNQQKEQSVLTSTDSEMENEAKQEETKSLSFPREVVNSDPLQLVRDVFQSIEDQSAMKAFAFHRIIHFTDTGGQPEFHEIIPSLVSGPSLFFLVFSLATGLKCKYEVVYRDACERLAEPYRSNFTVEEVMLQCLGSITCIGTRHNENGKVKIIRPKVMFIGTHRDLITDDHFQQINEELRKAIDPKIIDMDIVETASNNQFLFAVNNFDYKSNDSFTEIRRAVSGMASREKKMYCLNLPVPFVLLDFSLRQPADRLQKELSSYTGPVMKMKDFKLLAKKCGISATEIQEALWTLHHILGTIRYYPEVEELEDIVITQMQLFFNIPTRIIISTFSLRLNRDKISPQPCRDFSQKGFFTLSDLDKIWEKEKNYLSSKQLVALLMHLHILAPSSHTDHDGKKVSGYFLPCVLQHAPAQNYSDDQTLIAEPLLVKFECGFLLKGVFSGLLTFFLLLKPDKDELSFELCQSEQPFRDQASLYLCTRVKKCTYIYLTVRAMPEWIRFSLHYCQKVCDSSHLYTTVKKLIETGLQTVVPKLNYSVSTTTMFGYECKCCIQEPQFIEYKEGSNKCTRSKHYCDIPFYCKKWFEDTSSLLDEPVSDQHLEQISQYIDDWNKIARMLRLPNEDVTKIINDPSSPVSSQKVISTLKAWRQNHNSMMMATYRKLTDALSKCGADGQDLVEKITRLTVNAAKPNTTFADVAEPSEPSGASMSSETGKAKDSAGTSTKISPQKHPLLGWLWLLFHLLCNSYVAMAVIVLAVIVLLCVIFVANVPYTVIQYNPQQNLLMKEPRLNDIQECLNGMASKWRELGTCLEVEHGKLQSLSHDMSMSDTTRLIEVANEWDNSRCSPHTFEKLIDCLRMIDRDKYTKTIMEMLKRKKSYYSKQPDYSEYSNCIDSTCVQK